MKTAREILFRTVALFAVAMRATWEFDNSDGYRSPEELQPFADKIDTWLEKKGYYPYLTESEKTLIKSPIGVTPRKEGVVRMYDWEAVPVLLWALGLGELKDRFQDEDYIFKPAFDSLEFPDEEHDVDRILSRVKMRSEEEVEERCNLAFLWHWRAVETRLDPGWHGDIRQVIHNTFCGVHDDGLSSFALYDSGEDVDMIFRGRPVFTLTGGARGSYEVTAEMMHRALEWILCDEDWDETPTDT